jgi:hypothetical protein
MLPASHQATYRALPLLLGGLLGSFALLFGGIAGAFLLVAARGHQFPLMVGTMAVFVLFFAVCTLLALRRHRWTIDVDTVLIEERPLVPMTCRRRVRRVPFGQIANLNNVSNGPDELLMFTTRQAERFVPPSVRIKGDGPSPWPDQKALAAFAMRLQAAMTAAGVAAPTVTDGLGFWNRPPGLALLGIAFLASLAMAAVVLWSLWDGTILRARTHEAATLLVAAPILIGWLLRRSWRRRQSVMKAMRQSGLQSSGTARGST